MVSSRYKLLHNSHVKIQTFVRQGLQEPLRLQKMIRATDGTMVGSEQTKRAFYDLVDSSARKVEILSPMSFVAQMDKNGFATSVGLELPMLQFIGLSTGGVIVDGGWIRHLGIGGLGCKRSLMAWNRYIHGAQLSSWPFVCFADDFIGGFFAINLGGLGENIGNIFYFGPDTLDWEDLEISHEDFVAWTFTDRTDAFYNGCRSSAWKQEAVRLGADYALSIYPALWEEGPDICERDWNTLTVEELWTQHQECKNKLNRSLVDRLAV